MSKLSKLREAIDHLEAAENMLGEVRWAFGKESIEWNKITDQCELLDDAVYILTSGVLAHVESDLYKAALAEGEPISPSDAPKSI